MMLNLRAAVIAGLLTALAFAPAALAQTQGGILRQYMIDSPASMSSTRKRPWWPSGR